MRIFDPAVDQLNFTFNYNPNETCNLKSRTYEGLTLDDLRRFALWKLDRVLCVPEDVLARLRELATKQPLAARSEEAIQVLNDLVACEGVGYPMASAFLKFVRPDVFPIIDVRAYRALTGRKLRYGSYSTEIYLNYADRVTELSREIPLTFPEVDEQLYCFDKLYNGGIGA